MPISKHLAEQVDAAAASATIRLYTDAELVDATTTKPCITVPCTTVELSVDAGWVDAGYITEEDVRSSPVTPPPPRPTKPRYVWRLDVTYPEHPTLRPSWGGVGAGFEPFRGWPAVKDYLTAAGAERRANLLRSLGCTVEVLRSDPVTWMGNPKP